MTYKCSSKSANTDAERLVGEFNWTGKRLQPVKDARCGNRNGRPEGLRSMSKGVKLSYVVGKEARRLRQHPHCHICFDWEEKIVTQ